MIICIAKGVRASRPGLSLAQENPETSLLGERAPGASGGRPILGPAHLPVGAAPPRPFFSSGCFCEGAAWSSSVGARSLCLGTAGVGATLAGEQRKELHLAVGRPLSREPSGLPLCSLGAVGRKRRPSHSILDSGVIQPMRTAAPLILSWGPQGPQRVICQLSPAGAPSALKRALTWTEKGLSENYPRFPVLPRCLTGVKGTTWC